MIKLDFSLRLLTLVCVATLAACGGGGDDPAPAPEAAASNPSTGTGDTGSTGGDADAGDSATAANTGNCNVADFKAQALAQINAFRAQARTCGGASYPAVPALAWNDKLTQAAFGHSTDMATKNYFSHTSLDGRSAAQRVQATGYQWNTLGENIAAGQPTMTSVMQAWQGSAGHCKNLMAANFTEVGLSCVKASGSTYGTYWTMALAKPR